MTKKVETKPVPLDAPPPKFNPPPAEAQPVGAVRRDTGVTITLDRLPYYKGVRLASGTKLYAHPPPSVPVGVEGLNAAAVDAGHVTFESMRQCADSWLAVVDTLNKVAPGWNEKKGTGRECATAAIAALAQQPAAFRNDGNSEADFIADDAIACTACGGSGHRDDQQPAAVDEVISAARAAAKEYDGPLETIIYDSDDDEAGDRVCCRVRSYEPHAEGCPLIRLRAALAAQQGGRTDG